MHVGDWANESVLSIAAEAPGTIRNDELDNARAAIDIILAYDSGSMPLAFTLGNHDIVDDVDNRNDPDFVSKIPRSLFTLASWHGDSLGTGDDDHYVHSFLIDLGNTTNDLIICLPWAPVSDHWAWAIAQAVANPLSRVWIVTHAWLNSTGNLYTDQDQGVGGTNKFAPATSQYFSNFLDAAVDPGGTLAGNFQDGDWWNHARNIPNLAGIFSGHDIVPIGSSETAQQFTENGVGGPILHAYVNAPDIKQGGAVDGQHGFCQFVRHLGSGAINAWGYNLVLDTVSTGANDIFTLTVGNVSSGDLISRTVNIKQLVAATVER